MPHVFISYSRSDSLSAKMVADELQKRGLTIFIDYQHIVAGDSYLRQIGAEISKCDYMVLLMSQSAVASRHVRDEVESAYVKQKPIIVIRLDNTSLPDAFYFLDAKEHILALELSTQSQIGVLALNKLSKALGLTQDYIKDNVFWKAKTNSRVIASIISEPFTWIEIPDGTVRAFGKEHSQPTFYISKYPITYRQFQSFVDAEDGFSDSSWWDFMTSAQEWRNNNVQPQSCPRPINDHPRTNISWYEAIAFCRWINHRMLMHSEEINVSKPARFRVQLPDDIQWLRAAIGNTANKYPWGNEFDMGRCNSSVGINSTGTSSVFKFEGKGDSTFEVVDMCGNVWEWCRNSLGYHDRVDWKIGDRRILRGGSWDNTDPSNLEMHYRISNTANGSGSMTGFRIAMY